MIKRIISVVLVLALMLSMSAMAVSEHIERFSESGYVTIGIGFDTLIAPFGYAACLNGYCDALSKGWGSVYVNNKLAFNGCVWQCTKCHTVYVTENDPTSSHTWGCAVGKWASWNPLENIDAHLWNVYVSGYANESSSKIPGVNFRNY